MFPSNPITRYPEPTLTCALDLASHCRLLLHSRPKHKLLYRYLLLYPLYVLSEIAIISTDLAELLGSAIALCLIWPALPLWAGVLLTAGDVIFILALGDPLGGRPARMFEWLIAVLVCDVLVDCSYAWTDAHIQLVRYSWCSSAWQSSSQRWT